MYQARASRPSQAKAKTFLPAAFFTALLQVLLGLNIPFALEAQITTEPPRVLDTQAVGMDIEVTFFRGSPAPNAGGLQVVVTNSTCGEVGRIFASTPTEVVTVSVPNTLANGPTCDTQYTALLEDSSGPVGVALPFRLLLNCNQTSQCSYGLEPWVEVQDALLLSEELDQALAQATGQGDLIGAVSSQQPALRNAAFTHALHLNRLLAAQGTGFSNHCLCQWTGVVDSTGSPDSGRLHHYSAYACPANPAEVSTGSTTLRIVDRCHQLGNGPGTTLALPGGHSLSIPAFNRCAPPTEVPNTASFHLTFDGFAKVGGDLGYWAYATIHTEFTFDDGTFLDGSATAQRSAVDPWFVVSDPLLLDSGPVFATQATVSTAAEAQVTPANPNQQPPNIGAGTDGGLTLEAHGNLMQWIWFSKQHTLDPITDFPVDGDDSVECPSPPDQH